MWTHCMSERRLVGTSGRANERSEHKERLERFLHTNFRSGLVFLHIKTDLIYISNVPFVRGRT